MASLSAATLGYKAMVLPDALAAVYPDLARPARWTLTDTRRLIVASEAGVFDCAPENIIAKGKLGPGEKLAVDLLEGRLLTSEDIDAANRERATGKRVAIVGAGPAGLARPA